MTSLFASLSSFLSRPRLRLTRDAALRFVDALASASVGFPPLSPAELEWIRFAYAPPGATVSRRPDERGDAEAVRYGRAAGSR